MTVERIPFTEVPQFSKRDTDYATAQPELREFYKYDVDIEAFDRVMRDKDRDNTDRELLVDELEKQFEALPEIKAVRNQLGHLRSRQTYTVITAHQPSLFLGPLYFVIKICSTINLTRRLNERYVNRHFVPVFITGGEDHDFDEINHAYVYGNRIEWQNEESGPVGAMSTRTLGPALDRLLDILGDRETARGIYEIIERAYTDQESYGMASVRLVHELFGEYGLVTVDMSRPAFKRAFMPMMERELFDSVSQPLVEKAQGQLAERGYSEQAHAREINLFYLGGDDQQLRNRIVRNGDSYSVVDTAWQWTAGALREELRKHPERFSPNVVMRPLFQELIFPNLAYVGGGGELAYWLERKEQFEAFGLNFPMLVRRNSLLWIDGSNQKKLEKLDLDYRELFREADLIIRDYVAEASDNELSLGEEQGRLKEIFDGIATKAEEIDPTLKKAVMSEHAKLAKTVGNLEGRLRRTEKQRFDTAMNQIRKLREKLFPKGGLQERHDSFLNIYLQEGPAMFDTLIDTLDPLTPGLVVIRP